MDRVEISAKMMLTNLIIMSILIGRSEAFRWPDFLTSPHHIFHLTKNPVTVCSERFNSRYFDSESTQDRIEEDNKTRMRQIYLRMEVYDRLLDSDQKRTRHDWMKEKTEYPAYLRSSRICSDLAWDWRLPNAIFNDRTHSISTLTVRTITVYENVLTLTIFRAASSIWTPYLRWNIRTNWLSRQYKKKNPWKDKWELKLIRKRNIYSDWDLTGTIFSFTFFSVATVSTKSPQDLGYTSCPHPWTVLCPFHVFFLCEGAGLEDVQQEDRSVRRKLRK